MVVAGRSQNWQYSSLRAAPDWLLVAEHSGLGLAVEFEALHWVLRESESPQGVLEKKAQMSVAGCWRQWKWAIWARGTLLPQVLKELWARSLERTMGW